jgi:hypothetical protein
MTLLGQPLVKLVKTVVKTPLKPFDLLCRPELLPRSPNFTKTLQNLPM